MTLDERHGEPDHAEAFAWLNSRGPNPTRTIDEVPWYALQRGGRVRLRRSRSIGFGGLLNPLLIAALALLAGWMLFSTLARGPSAPAGSIRASGTPQPIAAAVEVPTSTTPTTVKAKPKKAAVVVKKPIVVAPVAVTTPSTAQRFIVHNITVSGPPRTQHIVTTQVTSPPATSPPVTAAKPPVSIPVTFPHTTTPGGPAVPITTP